MAVENYGNKYETTLNGGITNVATSIVVNSTTGVPATPFRAVLTDGTNYEYLNVTGRSGTTLTATREAEDSSRYPKRAWNSGDQLKHVITATGLMSHFDGTSGHDHSGGAGLGPRLPVMSMAAPPMLSVYKGAAQTFSNNIRDLVTWPNEYFDSTGNMHFTSAANLTGTLAKTSGSAAIVGTSTLFTSELAVGQIVYIPGGAWAERLVVAAIADNTHFTAGFASTSTASGQTATRKNDGLVAPLAGVYLLAGFFAFDPNATGIREFDYYLNDATYLGSGFANAAGGSKITVIPVAQQIAMNQWDFIITYAYQNSGGSLGSDVTITYPTLGLTWIGPLT